MNDRLVKKVSQEGVSYTMREYGTAGDGTVYVFNGSVGIEIIEEEENLAGIPHAVYGQAEWTVLKKIFSNTGGAKNPPADKTNWPDRTAATQVAIVVIDREILENREFREFIEHIIVQEFQLRIIIAYAKDENDTTVYTNFLLSHPKMKIREIHLDMESYFCKLWREAFSVEPSFKPEVLIRLMQCCVDVTLENMRNFVDFLSDKMDTVPDMKDIHRLLNVYNKKGWRQQLEGLVAMDDAKQKILTLIQKQIYLSELKKNGYCEEYMPIRAMVCGEPGVGKSSLLKILEDAFREEGLLHKGAAYVSCRSLISDHIGGSEARLNKLVEENDLLILDELGGLNVGDRFDEGVIQQLVFFMESRKDLHIVYVGYDQDMDDFMKRNIGIFSRIQDKIHIDNYTPEELVEIGISMLKNYGYEFIEADIRTALRDFAERVVKIPNYGNARAMRTLVEHVVTYKSMQLDKTGELDLNITVEELQQAENTYFNQVPQEKCSNPIGFAADNVD